MDLDLEVASLEKSFQRFCFAHRARFSFTFKPGLISTLYVRFSNKIDVKFVGISTKIMLSPFFSSIADPLIYPRTLSTNLIPFKESPPPPSLHLYHHHHITWESYQLVPSTQASPHPGRSPPAPTYIISSISKVYFCALCIFRVASGVSNIIDHPLTKQQIIDRFLFF